VPVQATTCRSAAPSAVQPGRAGRALGATLCLLVALLAGCASGPQYTVDDGRPVNETLLAHIRAYGRGEQAVRPAIARSAALKDKDCDKQWELPFSVASSEAWPKDERVAWVRALGVDERLTVVAVAPGAPLKLGEHLVGLYGRRENNAEIFTDLLSRARDLGQPFSVLMEGGRQVQIQPFQVCRGYTRLAPPNAAETQDYHWLMSVHPLELGQVELGDDEALWTVLWTQGLSEEGGVRMKAYHYGTQVVGTLYNLFTIATGLKGAAVAAEAAVKAAQTAATNLASDLLKQQLIKQAQEFAAMKLRATLADTTQLLAQQQAVVAMQQAAVNRGALTGVARIGATVFDRADQWAFDRARLLNANPIAGFSLHEKLVERGLASNAFVFDAERLAALTQVAEAQGLGDAVVAALNGLRPANLAQELEGMPLASAPRGFSYEDALSTGTGGRYANGLIAATLDIPVESGP